MQTSQFNLSKATRMLATRDNNHIWTYIKNHQDTADIRLKNTRADWINGRTTGHTRITWRRPSRSGGPYWGIRLCVRQFDSLTCCYRKEWAQWAPGPLAWYWEFAKLHTRSLRTLASEYNRNLRPQQCQTSCSPASARLHPPNKEWWLDKHFHLPRRSEKQKTRSFGPWLVANKADTCQELQKRLPSDLLWNPYRSVSCAIHRLPCPPRRSTTKWSCRANDSKSSKSRGFKRGKCASGPANWQSKYSGTTLLFTSSLIQNARDHIQEGSY